MGLYDKKKGKTTVFDGKPFFAMAFVQDKAVVGQSWFKKSFFLSIAT
jgi:acetolactate decarboxylase